MIIDDGARYRDLRILVIEDEGFSRRIITGLLRQIGFTQVFEARDGDEGMRETLRSRPQVILCDIHMEPLDGLGYLAPLPGHADPEIAAIPVLLLTAVTQPEHEMSAR